MRLRGSVAMAVAGALLAGAACGSRSPRPAPRGPYNLLLITADTLRADCVGYAGLRPIKTPNIDRLARSGMRFLRHVAPSQCTLPAHDSIMTGLYPMRHGVLDNETALSGQAQTLAEILKSRGYSTLAAVSARHMNDTNSALGQGFDLYLGCRPVEMKAFERNAKFLPALDLAAAKAPFFAWVHFYDPHGDYDPPAPYDKLYPARPELAPVPWWESMNIPRERARPDGVHPGEVIARYQGEVSAMDSEIGRILVRLSDLGAADRTLVVFVGDHGESMTEHGIYFCHAGMFEQVLRVPFAMALPGVVPEGAAAEGVTSSVDILPTVLEVLGAGAPPGPVDGKSLVPMFARPSAGPHEAVFAEAVDGQGIAAYADGFKLIEPLREDWAITRTSLFRPFEDEGETRDLAAERPEVVESLRAMLRSWAGPPAFPPENRPVDPAVVEALKSLGYIKGPSGRGR